MPVETEQRNGAETLDRRQSQVRAKKTCRVSIERQMRATGITALPSRSESCQESVSDIEWLSTAIVHDLRNPLATVYAAAETLLDLDPGLPQVKRLATNIHRAASRMQELLADLYSAAPGNRVTAEMCDIRKVIAAACDAAGTGSENSRVLVLLGVPEGIKLPLVRHRMERVFFNLVANALEAMPTGGQLSIKARKNGDGVLIEFEDTGPGIPHGARERLFEPFVTAGKPDGLGLGLALSRATVLEHGGDIWTEPATGARFVIRLPLNPARPSQKLYRLAASSTSGDVSNQ